MAEGHRRRSKVPAVEAWLAAYDIASSAVVSAEQEHTFKALLPRLKDIDSVPPELIEGRCPLLQQAAGKGHLNLIKLLLEAGANINYRFHSYKFVRKDGYRGDRIDLKRGVTKLTLWVTALRSACRFAQIGAFNMLVEHGCNLNAEDIGHVPINHAIYSGNVAMVEALLSHDVSLCLPEILQDAVLQCQARERELNSFRTSGVLPPHIIERQKREMMLANPNSASEAPPTSIKRPGSTSINPSQSSSSSSSSSSSDKMLSDDLENRIAIVQILLHANIRLPLNAKPIWLPYLRSHHAFKSTIDTMINSSTYTFDRVRTLEFANMTTVELVGECIDDEKAATIAKLMIAASSRTPLLHLNLSRNWIEQRGATEIGLALSRNSTLLTLNLAHNFIQDCTHMMKGMKDNRTLKSLDLSANRLATVAGEAIAMRLPTLRLTSLNLAMNKLEHRGGMQVLRAVLSHETMDVENRSEHEPLAFNSSGRSVTLGTASAGDSGSSGSDGGSNVRRGSSGTSTSSSTAGENAPVSTLTSLNLSSNEIHPYEKNLFTDDLVAKLTTNTVLTNLDLSFNWIGNSDLVRLVRALAHNVQLANLALKGYALTEDDLKQMMAALSLNFTITSFQFDHSPPSQTCDALRRHILKNSILFSNSHLIHDPIVPDAIEAVTAPSPNSTPSTNTPSPTNNTSSSSSLEQAYSTDDSDTKSAASGISSAEEGNGRNSSPLSGMAPTRLSFSKARSESLAAVPQISPRTCPTDAKQYGLVKKGESRADTTDILSIPDLDEKCLTPMPNGQVTEVHAAGRELNCFPPCILGYDGLTKLVLQRNKLTSLPRAIGCLKSLVVLDVRNNRLPALPPEIGDLPKLSFLLASYNKLQFVPMQLTRQPSLKYVLLHPNPLTLLPPNFRKTLPQLWKKSFQESELYQYLKTIGACGEGTFNKGRLMLVGDPAVGKTTIRKTLVRGKSGFSLFDWLHARSPVQEVSVATDGIDIDVVRMSDRDGKKYMFDVWDYAGHEVYYTTHTFFLSPRAVYLLVFNMENYSRLSIEYWMQSIVFKAGTEAPIFLVGTHPEKLSPAERTSLLAQLKSNYRGVFVDLVWINPVSGEGVEELKQKVCKIAAQRKLIGETVPKSYMRIADQLLATAQTRPYMPLKEIAGIVLSNDVPQESVDAAISWLIDIGSVLSYSPNRAPDQIVFIDPQFLCNTFSQVVSIKYSSTTGRLSRGVIASICRQDAKLQAELFRILRSFDLAYVLKRAQDDVKYDSSSGSSGDIQQEIELFVPALLADNEPADLYTTHWKPNPMMRVYQRHFTFPFLPLGFFSKLLVRCLLLPGVEPLCYWSNGIVARKRSGLENQLLDDSGSGSSDGNDKKNEKNGSSGNNKDIAAAASGGPVDLFFLKFEPEKNLLTMQANVDQDGVTLALLVDLVGALISERYPQAEYSTTIPISTSLYETVYLNVDELASNIASGQYVKVVEGKVWNISMFAPDLVLKDLSNLRVDDADIEKGRRLGVGSFGEVFEATYHGEQCAVKYITRFRELANESDFFRTRSSDFANFAHEIRIMNLLRHPNIVRMKGYIPRPVGLLMEFFACGDLVGLLEKDPLTNWPLRIRIALDIALGMEYLHMLEPPLCHRDLRSPNILLKSKQADSTEPVAKVADFGLTVAVVDRLGYGPTESWRWSAPEVVTAEQYTHRSDIWSFGILLLELIYAELPYQSLQKSMGKREDEMSRLYMQGAFRPEFPTSFENHAVPPFDDQEHNALKLLAQLGRDCCSEAPDARPAFSTIKSRLCQIADSMGTLKLPDCIRFESQRTYASMDEENDDEEQATREESGQIISTEKVPRDEINDSQSSPIPRGNAASLSLAVIPRKAIGYKLDETRKFVLADRKSPATFMTTAVLAVGSHLWIGLADGTLGVWDVSALLECKGTSQSEDSSTNDILSISSLRLVGDHLFSIRGIVVNENATKLCAISEDGYFTIVNLKDFSSKKYLASPGNNSPLLSICTIGERLYIGTAKGHVVAWSWDTPTLLAFWDGMDRQPVCQLFYTRGTRDLVVTYGHSIKFLNIFDLGDTLRHWKPQIKPSSTTTTPNAASNHSDTSSSSSSNSAGMSPSDSAESHSSASSSNHFKHAPSSSNPTIAIPANSNTGSTSGGSSSSQLPRVERSGSNAPLISQDHHRLAASAKISSNVNDALFKNVYDCQHAAHISAAGPHVWTKSGPFVRLWSVHRSKGNPISSSASTGLVRDSARTDSGDTVRRSSPSSPSSRSNAFLTSISLHKELISPNLEACYKKLVAPTMINNSEHVFVLESPAHITSWDISSSCFSSTLTHPTDNPCIENIVLVGKNLVAVARDHLYVWRPEYQATASSESSLIPGISSSPNNPPPLKTHD